VVAVLDVDGAGRPAGFVSGVDDVEISLERPLGLDETVAALFFGYWAPAVTAA
jgi:hypothetical protein